MSFGGMQLLPTYKAKLEPAFLDWYFKTFTADRMCYGHWSAGYRNQNWPEYHIVVCQDNGDVWANHNCPTDEDLSAHTFARNTNSFAICLAGMYNAQTDNLGGQAPTPDQIRRFIQETVDACIANHVPVANLLDHASAADNVDQGPDPPYDTPGAPTDIDPVSGKPFNSPYGPLSDWTRWDIHVWCDPKTFNIEPPAKPCPEGWLWFVDVWRGEVALEIQRQTQAKWQGGPK